jgi:hypothetical protein
VFSPVERSRLRSIARRRDPRGRAACSCALQQVLVTPWPQCHRHRSARRRGSRPRSSTERRDPSGSCRGRPWSGPEKPVPPLATATRKRTGRESNPYASRRRNLKPGWRPRILWGSRKQAPAAIRVGPKCGVLAPAWGNPDARGTGEDQVEAALARALDRASEAGRFDVVAQLARELEALRLAHLTNDVAFTDARGASRRAVMTDGRNLCVWCRGGRQPDRGPE